MRTHFKVAAVMVLLASGSAVLAGEPVAKPCPTANRSCPTSKSRAPKFQIESGISRLNHLCNSVGLQVEHCRDDASVAKKQLAAAEGEWKQTQLQLDKTMDIMVALRDLLRCDHAWYEVGGRRYSRNEVSNALAEKLCRYQELQRIDAQREQTMAAWRGTYKRLSQRADDWETRRRNLIERVTELKTLREQKKTEAAHREVSLENETLGRAESLISELENDLSRVVPATHEETIVDGVVAEFDELVRERQQQAEEGTEASGKQVEETDTAVPNPTDENEIAEVD